MELPRQYKRTDSVYAKLLDSRGLAIKAGWRLTGREKTGIKFEVVDRLTGEDRGVRWIRRRGEKWEVSKEKL